MLTSLDAGTINPVYIRLSGSKGLTDWRLLSKNGFKAGYWQKFYVKTVDVGTVNKMELRISGSDGWDMYKVCCQIYSVFEKTLYRI